MCEPVAKRSDTCFVRHQQFDSGAPAMQGFRIASRFLLFASPESCFNLLQDIINSLRAVTPAADYREFCRTIAVERSKEALAQSKLIRFVKGDSDRN